MALGTALWLACAPLFTGAFVGLVVALWFARDDPVLFVALSAGATVALLLRVARELKLPVALKVGAVG